MNNKNIQIRFNAKITPLSPVNEEFTLCKCYVQGIGKNRNGSYMSKENVEKYSATLSYCPVVGHIIEATDPNTKESHRYMGGHDWTIDESWEIVDLTVPYGVVVNDTFDYEIVNEYGVDIEYLTANVILWTGRYPELKESIYAENFWFNQSMEINPKQYRTLEDDSNYVEILEWSYSALCLLGKADDKNSPEHTEPCFINSGIIPLEFSKQDFFMEFEELKERLSVCFNYIDLEKGGKNLDKKETTVSKYGKTFSDLDFAYADMTNEEFETKMSELFGKKENIELFSTTYRQKREALSNALESVVLRDVNGNVTEEIYYYVEDFDDTYVYVEKDRWTSNDYETKYGRFTYSFDDSSLTAAIAEEFQEMIKVWLTLEENQQIQAERNSFSELVKEFSEYKEAHSVPNEEVNLLKAYQANKEANERDLEEKRIFNKYEKKIGTTNEYCELKKTSSNFSIKDLEKECLYIVGLYSVADEPDDSIKGDSIKFSATNEKNNVDPIDATYKKYLNR